MIRKKTTVLVALMATFFSSGIPGKGKTNVCDEFFLK